MSTISRAALSQQMQQLMQAAKSATAADGSDVVLVNQVPDAYREAVREVAGGADTVTLAQLEGTIARVEKAAATADADRWIDGAGLGENMKRLVGAGGRDDGRLSVPEQRLAHALASGTRVAHLLQQAIGLIAQDGAPAEAAKPARVSAQDMPTKFQGVDTSDDNVATVGLAPGAQAGSWSVTVATGGMIGGAKTFEAKESGDSIVGVHKGDYGENIAVSISMLEGRHVAELQVTEISEERSYMFHLTPGDD